MKGKNPFYLLSAKQTSKCFKCSSGFSEAYEKVITF